MQLPSMAADSGKGGHGKLVFAHATVHTRPGSHEAGVTFGFAQGRLDEDEDD